MQRHYQCLANGWRLPRIEPLFAFCGCTLWGQREYAREGTGSQVSPGRLELLFHVPPSIPFLKPGVKVGQEMV